MSTFGSDTFRLKVPEIAVSEGSLTANNIRRHIRLKVPEIAVSEGVQRQKELRLSETRLKVPEIAVSEGDPH